MNVMETLKSLWTGMKWEPATLDEIEKRGYDMTMEAASRFRLGSDAALASMLSAHGDAYDGQTIDVEPEDAGDLALKEDYEGWEWSVLRSEATRRGIKFTSSWKASTLRRKLREDDEANA